MAVHVEEEESRHRKVSLMTKLSFGTGHVLNDMSFSMWMTYVLIYFTNVVGLSGEYAGLVLLAGQVTDGIGVILVGAVLDKSNSLWPCRSYGKHKSWHLIGTLLVMVSFPFLFSPCLACSSDQPDPSQTTQLAYFAVFAVIFQFGWAAVQISHLSMIPALSTLDSERTSLTTIRYAATVISYTIVFCLTWAWLGTSNGSEEQEAAKIGPADQSTFQNVALVCTGLGGISSLIFHLCVKINSSSLGNNSEYESLLRPTQPLQSTPNKSVTDWLTELQFYQVSLVYMTAQLFINIFQSIFPFYLEETLRLSSESVAVIPLVMFLSGFVVSRVSGPLSSLIGQKMTFAAACLTGLASCLWINFGNQHTLGAYMIYPLAILIEASKAQMFISSLCLASQLIGGNLESSAFIYGCMSLLDKFSTGIGIMVIERQAPKESYLTGGYYHTILSTVCGTLALVGLITVATLMRNRVGTRQGRNKDKDRLRLADQSNCAN